ncbi:sulfotransferase [Algicella marina]|uniref:Sulfotransferase n=1 Tax=Algicella marina TaxID=2683284 RepID=A0A6P1SY90_9RHOB|nr:sulfotransferase [Algicella marina]QHQ33959.1 hypothetical protein GO499_01560 [Algicella marina]
MPNESNVTSPVTLISAGRSGTSLLQGIFRHHPDFQTCGETISLVIRGYFAAEKVLPFINNEQHRTDEQRCGAAVRGMFLQMMPSEEKYWFHKPLGAATIGRDLSPASDPEGYRAWYWNAMKQSFPDGTFITILRHPCDVILSRAKWFKEKHEQGLAKICEMADIIADDASPVSVAVSHKALVDDGEAELRRVFAAIDRPFHPACLKALDVAFVQERGKPFRQKVENVPERAAQGFSNRDRWNEIDKSILTDDARGRLDRMWAKFGQEIDWP